MIDPYIRETMMTFHHPTRRTVLAGGAALAATALTSPLHAQSTAVAMRPIPSSGESIPAMGLGTWITFNVGDDPVLRDECAAVMAAFFESGGRMIDSSPMYGSSQPVIGHGLAKLGTPPVFSADKVWTSSDGPAQIEQSRQYWGVPRFDLLQVHNLVAWQDHRSGRSCVRCRCSSRTRWTTTSTPGQTRSGCWQESWPRWASC